VGKDTVPQALKWNIINKLTMSDSQVGVQPIKVNNTSL